MNIPPEKLERNEEAEGEGMRRPCKSKKACSADALEVEKLSVWKGAGMRPIPVGSGSMRFSKTQVAGFVGDVSGICSTS